MLAVVEQGFTGKIVRKGASPPFALPQEGEPLNLAGYDCVGISLVPWDADLEGFREMVRERLGALVALAEEQGFEPMITEFGIWGPGKDLPPEVQAEAISVIFEEGQRTGIRGYIVFDSPSGEYLRVKGSSIEEVVKRFFRSM